jgi:hypothetical protein
MKIDLCSTGVSFSEERILCAKICGQQQKPAPVFFADETGFGIETGDFVSPIFSLHVLADGKEMLGVLNISPSAPIPFLGGSSSLAKIFFQDIFDNLTSYLQNSGFFVKGITFSFLIRYRQGFLKKEIAPPFYFSL